MRSSRLAKLALTFLMAIQGSGSPALAALNSSSVQDSINKRQFLAPGTALNVKIDKDQVYVSTFRHSSAEEKDCKIDAVLISKAAFDTAPDEVARVTCYFYGKDLANYQEVSVSAGDIKAFSTGQMSKEQLLASLVVRTATLQNENDKVARQLESSTITSPTDYKITVDKDTINVSTALEPWVTDEDSKLEAYRVAVNAFHAQPAAQQIKVTFNDPAGNADGREFTFKANRLEDIWKIIQNSLADVTMAKRPASVDLQSLKTSKGEQQEARDALLAQLKDMDKKGIGIAPFVKAFLVIEQSVKREADPKYIIEMVSRLKASMDDQMRAYASAKEKKATTKAPDSCKAPPATAAAPTGSRWVTGESPVVEGEVLANPDQLVAQYEARLSRGFQRVEDNPKFAALLEQVASILIKNNRAAEAGKYQQRAQQIRVMLQQKKK